MKTIPLIKAYDRARRNRDTIIKFYGGYQNLGPKLDLTGSAIRMWKYRNTAIPVYNAHHIADWGDFDFEFIRPDLKKRPGN